MACVGNPRLRADSGAVQVEAPFSMRLSPRCASYYSLARGEEVAQGRGRCPQCRQEGLPSHLPSHLQDNNNTWSGSQTDEDMKVGYLKPIVFPPNLGPYKYRWFHAKFHESKTNNTERPPTSYAKRPLAIIV